MANLITDTGWGLANTNAAILTRWPLAGSSLFLTSSAPFGCGYNSTPSSATFLERQLPGNYATLYAGNRFTVSALTAATDCTLIAFKDDITTQVDVRVKTNGSVIVTRNGTQLGSASAPGVIALGTNFVEFSATISDAAGAYEVKVNGTSVLSGSSADTKQTANAFANRLFINGGNGSGNSAIISDIYCNDGAGGDTYYGPGWRVDHWQLAADGAHTDSTPLSSTRKSNVDDSTGFGVGNDGDTTYNSMASSGQRDTFTLTAGATAGTIKSVAVSVVARQDDAATVSLRPVLKTGASVTQPTATALSTSYTEKTAIFQVAADATTLNASLTSSEVGYETA